MRNFIIEKVAATDDVSGLYKILSDESKLNSLRPMLRMFGVQL